MYIWVTGARQLKLLSPSLDYGFDNMWAMLCLHYNLTLQQFIHILMAL